MTLILSIILWFIVGILGYIFACATMMKHDPHDHTFASILIVFGPISAALCLLLYLVLGFMKIFGEHLRPFWHTVMSTISKNKFGRVD